MYVYKKRKFWRIFWETLEMQHMATTIADVAIFFFKFEYV